MAQKLTLNLATPVSSVNIICDNNKGSSSGSPAAKQHAANLEQEEILKQANGSMSVLCKTLENAITKINNLHEDIISAHNEEIAKFSIKIAEKILLSEIQAGHYDIEKIVQETLKTAPNPQEVTIRLNPDDLQKLQQTVDNNSIASFKNTKMIPDANIGRAQCIIETDKGIVRYFIDEHLKQIDKALRNVE